MRVRIDMTSGNPLKRMLAFCWPMILGSALMQVANLLDGLIIGRAAGVGAFAAVAAAAPVAFLATGFMMGFCNGFLIPIALSVGAGDRDAADRFSCAALMMTGVMALMVAIPSGMIAERLVALAGTPADIAAHASGTMVVRCVVTVDGRLKDCRVVEGSIPEMDAEVVRALEQRVYEPATLDGRPVEVNYNFRITLRAQ
jgi:TonB family protein